MRFVLLCVVVTAPAAISALVCPYGSHSDRINLTLGKSCSRYAKVAADCPVLAARNDIKLLCMQSDADTAGKDAVCEGINYLHDVEDENRMPPGPNVCGRVSCSYNTGIFVCNDNPTTFTTSWTTVSDFAGQIAQTCYTEKEDSMGSYPVVKGNQFRVIEIALND
ncbi:uncharacterized protein BCR38DRAFT_411001 [Pseudomassariella vexata]|uniref:Cyanovirin-N domain-containing protein n=1 Tax=Pseudomassariella vexata TaxID=1141098 RepID=A0A1Y2DTJ8_9PEZI|nr:uncharacterized protein BCR38DRAFT_411001 [Pseudomassariella vexata]ORY62603.1 hypothetical protein BCR38DRAFT_411001 [Pseudomassariella vexata]